MVIGFAALGGTTKILNYILSVLIALWSRTNVILIRTMEQSSRGGVTKQSIVTRKTPRSGYK